MTGITPRICNSRTDAWSYKIDEIDPSVLSELPPEVQAEVRASIRPQKRANIVKKGSSIAHYFSPTPNSWSHSPIQRLFIFQKGSFYIIINRRQEISHCKYLAILYYELDWAVYGD